MATLLLYIYNKKAKCMNRCKLFQKVAARTLPAMARFEGLVFSTSSESRLACNETGLAGTATRAWLKKESKRKKLKSIETKCQHHRGYAWDDDSQRRTLLVLSHWMKQLAARRTNSQRSFARLTSQRHPHIHNKRHRPQEH